MMCFLDGCPVAERLVGPQESDADRSWKREPGAQVCWILLEQDQKKILLLTQI